MDNCKDLSINCAVRKVMVRHWIDLGKLSMRTTAGVVRLSGSLCRLPGATGELTCALILTILAELKRVSHVRRVTANFDNWTNNGAEGWKPIGMIPAQPVVHRRPAHEPTSDSSADAAKVYDVEAEVDESTEPAS